MPKGKGLGAAPNCEDLSFGRVSGKSSARGNGPAYRSGCSWLETRRWIAGVLASARGHDQTAAGGDVSPSAAISRGVGFWQPALALALSISSAAWAIPAPFGHVAHAVGLGSETCSAAIGLKFVLIFRSQFVALFQAFLLCDPSFGPRCAGQRRGA